MKLLIMADIGNVEVKGTPDAGTASKKKLPFFRKAEKPEPKKMDVNFNLREFSHREGALTVDKKGRPESGKSTEFVA